MSQGGACPWTDRAGWFLGAVFTAMVLCVVFDKEADNILRVLGWLGLLIAAVTSRQPRRMRHAVWVIGSFVGIGLIAGVCSLLWGQPGEAAQMAAKYFVPVIWFALLWVAVPVFARAEPRWAGGLLPWADRWARWLVGLLLGLCVWATFSTAASLFPKDSFELLGAELLPFAGLFIIFMRAAPCGEKAWWQTAAFSGWSVVLTSVLVMAGVMLLSLVSQRLSTGFLEAELFRVDEDAPDTRRLQFLFGHHNRAGFFSAVAIFVCLAGVWFARKWRWLAISGAAAAAFVLPFTLTRGALVAAAIAMLLFIVTSALRHRRGGWIVLAAVIIIIPAAWVALPDSYQAHISKITDRENYREEAGGSIAARLVMWDAAKEMIKRRPVLGFGYGYENFENAVRLDNPHKPEYFSGSSHAHNMWLETGAETGIPGMALLFAFTVLRMGGLARAWWTSFRANQPVAWLLMLWLCLEVVVQVYGLTNYSLRRNLGVLTYVVWAGSVVLVLRVGRRGGGV